LTLDDSSEYSIGLMFWCTMMACDGVAPPITTADARTEVSGDFVAVALESAEA
jgi:hypothetical protein